MTNKNAAVLYEVNEKIAVITLNRPDHMNAIVQEVREGVLESFQKASRDKDVRVIVLTGAGKVFSGGGDINQMKKFQDDDYRASTIEHKTMPTQNHAILAMYRTEKPIVAAINGSVAGGAMGMALACDIRIASSKAKFSMAFNRIGLCPEWGMAYNLPRIVGEDKAKELIWLANKLTAEEALDLGIVSKLAEPEEVLDTAMTMARELASRPPVAVRLTKKILNHSLSSGVDAMLDMESYARNICIHSQDFKEGIAAMVEKRPPVFKGE